MSLRTLSKLAAFVLFCAALASAQTGQHRKIFASAGESVVQAHIAVGAFGTNQTTTIVFSSNVTSGNVLVTFAAVGAAVSAWTTPTGLGTGCLTTTWTVQGTPSTALGVNVGAWAGTASGTGSCTVTIGATFTSSTLTGAAVEYSGGTTSGIAISTYKSQNCTTCTGNTITTPPNGIITTFFAGNNAGPYSAPSPFSFGTNSINANDGQGVSVGVGYYTNSSSSTYSPSWTATNFVGQGSFSIDIP